MNKNILNYIKILSYNSQIQILLIETIGNILLKQDNIESFIQKNEMKIIHIRDWITSIIENNEEWKTPRVLTLDALNNAADKYFEKKNNKLKTIELDENQEKLVADLGDYYIVQMLTPKALDNESKVMQHCIGHGYYDERLNDDDCKYLSLRDKFNKAHVTLEIFKNEIIQLQGKQNQIPDIKYLEKMLPWLIENSLLMNQFGLIINKNDNQIYDINNLPNNCEIDGDLEFYNLDIEILPDNLIINGNLKFSFCQKLNKLSKGLNVKGSLNLQGTTVSVLPDDMKVGKNLILNSLKIKEIPKNFISNGNLSLYSCKNLEKLPDNLIVNGNLDLSKSSILKLPDNLIVNGDLFLSQTSIINLPNNLNIKNSLSLINSKIQTIPKDIKIGKIYILMDLQ